MKTMRAKTNKKILTLEIVIIMVIVTVVAITIIHERKNTNEEKEYENLRGMITQTNDEGANSMQSGNDSLTKTPLEETSTTSPQSEDTNLLNAAHDFIQLSKVNPDIYAWILVEDTPIDYPIVQRKDDDGYYLDHNIDGTDGYPGCIFTENINHKDFEDFLTVIYGHNMRNGTMFAPLHKYEDQDYYEKHREITISTAKEQFHYQIIGSGTHDDDSLLYTEKISSVKEIKDLLMSFKKDSSGVVSKDVIQNLSEQDKFIILSTCNGWNTSTRYLVVAVRVQ